jgi:flagellum-specific peptidoglycan hydrolase FlgJ
MAMEKISTQFSVLTTLQKFWFQIGVAALILYVFFQNDVSFQVNLQKPSPVESPTKKPAESEGFRKSTSVASSGDQFDLSLPARHSSSDVVAIFRHTSEQARRAFLQRFAHVAVSESHKFRIPASVILANGLLQSAAGTSELLPATQNMFRLPCTADWRGKHLTSGSVCFRKYPNAWESFRDHSLLLSLPELKASLPFGKNNYRLWAKKLEQTGIWPSPGVAPALIEIIETYDLAALDSR